MQSNLQDERQNGRERARARGNTSSWTLRRRGKMKRYQFGRLSSMPASDGWKQHPHISIYSASREQQKYAPHAATLGALEELANWSAKQEIDEGLYDTIFQAHWIKQSVRSRYSWMPYNRNPEDT